MAVEWRQARRPRLRQAGLQGWHADDDVGGAGGAAICRPRRHLLRLDVQARRAARRAAVAADPYCRPAGESEHRLEGRQWRADGSLEGFVYGKPGYREADDDVGGARRAVCRPRRHRVGVDLRARRAARRGVVGGRSAAAGARASDAASALTAPAKGSRPTWVTCDLCKWRARQAERRRAARALDVRSEPRRRVRLVRRAAGAPGRRDRPPARAAPEAAESAAVADGPRRDARCDGRRRRPSTRRRRRHRARRASRPAAEAQALLDCVHAAGGPRLRRRRRPQPAGVVRRSRRRLSVAVADGATSIVVNVHGAPGRCVAALTALGGRRAAGGGAAEAITCCVTAARTRWPAARGRCRCSTTARRGRSSASTCTTRCPGR